MGALFEEKTDWITAQYVYVVDRREASVGGFAREKKPRLITPRIRYFMKSLVRSRIHLIVAAVILK